MANSHRNTIDRPQGKKRFNVRSCTFGCLGYLAGIATVPAIVLWEFNRPEVKQERFLDRKTNECRRCDLSNQNLQLRNFNEANFFQANLQNIVFGGAKLKKANFTRANLQGAVLRQANLEDAIFDGANLSGADFSCGGGTCTYLKNTSFKNANLTEANFQSVGFSVVGEKGLPDVDFTAADLTKANFQGASLKGAAIARAKLCQTKMPDGKIDNRDCSE